MRIHHCKQQLDADHLAGTKLDESHYDILLGGDEACDIYKPDGTPLVKYRPRWFDDALCNAVLPACRKAARKTDNRGLAAGRIDEYSKTTGVIGQKRGTRYVPLKSDGTFSKTTRAATVASGIIGYFERTARFPFCRQTAFVIQEAAAWRSFLPFIERADAGFRECLPERWQAQRDIADRTPPEWLIPQSTFTTVTVNRNFQTATHKDAGDLHEGFGVMAVLKNDRFGGGYLTFPAFRVAVDMAHRSLCLADVHEWHSNTSFTDIKHGYERISLVFYYREHMQHCLPAAEEVTRVKHRQRGQKLRAERTA